MQLLIEGPLRQKEHHFDIMFSRRMTANRKLGSNAMPTLLNKGTLTAAECNRLNPREAVILRMYGVPKTHTDGLNIQPIVSMTNCLVTIVLH